VKSTGESISDPDILGGKVAFKGTRVPVQSLFDRLEAGDSIDDFLEGFPSVRRTQVIAILKESRQQIRPRVSLRTLKPLELGKMLRPFTSRKDL
jgi:uncharacterized protein (DUF433 family)